MKGDPSTERARSVVTLVILTVAVPSLLLTALGAVAVENEEAAANMRIQQLYEPVAWEAAERFNAKMDQLVADSAAPFLEMVKLATEEDADREVINSFIDRTGDFGINYFVLDPGGEVMVPKAPSGERAAEKTTPPIERALAHELANYGSKSACNKWTSVSDGCEEERCAAEVLRSMCRLTNGQSGAYRFSDECHEYAAAPLSKAAIRSAALEHEHSDRVKKDLELAVGKEPIHVAAAPESQAAAKRVMESAKEFVRVSKEQESPQSSLLSTVVAKRMLARLEKNSDTGCTRDLMQAIVDRPVLLEQLSSLSHPRDTAVQVLTIETNDFRRVIVAKSIEGWLVGFELSACAFRPYLDELIAKKGLDDALSAEVHSIQMPKAFIEKMDWEDYEARQAAWLLLKKTNLAWKLVLMQKEHVGFPSMNRSRSTLYFWALILIAGALIAGIVYTIRTVSNEARLARLKTDFVSSVSHDLRTPLTSIRMFTETLLLGRASSKEEEQEFLQVIADETDRLSRLTERILDFSRMEAGRKAYQFAPAQVPELVTQALRATRPMIEEAKFDVSVEMAEELPSIEVDRDAMVEVLINLISNAIKYSPDERMICVRAFVEKGRIAIGVTDRGIGIAKSEHGKIFEKFYRVDSRRATEVGGTGLGLSLVRHIVTAHGGEVTVESALGAGSTFTVWLPVEGSWRASSS